MRHFLLICIASIYLFATPQLGETFIVDKKRYQIHENPLSSYIYDKKIEFAGTCSACWRGYHGTWKMEDDYLYIINLIECTCSSDEKEIPLSKLFPKQKAKKVKAIWFTGTITISKGRVVNHTDIDHMPIYENDILFSFKNGKLIERKVVLNKSKAQIFLNKQ